MCQKLISRVIWIFILAITFILFMTPVFATAVNTEEFRTVIADMPRLGASSVNFPPYVSFHGDPTYAGSFSGQYNGLDINGYVDNGVVASISIRPVAGSENGADIAAVAQFIADIYGRPVFAHAPEVYEWKYILNESRWTLHYFGNAGVIQGNR